jgi:hypothetical protein
MRVTHLLPLAVFTAQAVGQAGNAIFEPKDFDVKYALERIGVSVSRLPEPNPEMATLGERPIFTRCSFAVSTKRVYIDRSGKANTERSAHLS